ncbi:unnamed protein product [Candidula unifasciata]|uniref:T-cell activation inhibitor, mitochondrial n=1 Tax=Candidula unifasciata TaxID=100452 RepID=A0A8S3YC31_9EUPU|nr:unnamed protein product [Candidula unifasciata]
MFKSLKVTWCRRLLYNTSLCPVFKSTRHFTARDASAALKPFYFIVHPDLFGQHPAERAVNENSLKLLNEYLTGHASDGKNEAKEIVFYIRSQDNSEPALKQVKIYLTTSNLRETVMDILTSSGLPSSHVPQTKCSIYGTNRPIVWHPSYYAATGRPNPQGSHHASRPAAVSLRSWLQMNIERSRKYEKSVKFIQDDVARLLKKLQMDLGVEDIRFDSVWGCHHFRGCLTSFDRLFDNHPEFLQLILKGRTLVFSNSTGVSKLGEIILSSEDVPQTWITLLQSVKAYDAVLDRLPKMESKLSSLLNSICVVRQRKQHCHVMAGEYELLLNKLLNSLRRCQDHVIHTFKNKDLSTLQLVVEGESSPMMLSSHGQFLIPASVPGTLAVDFVHENIHEALGILQRITRFLDEEEESKKKAIEVLGLYQLNKDESVTPEQMISCCSRISEQHWGLSVSLENSKLRVSHYYSVMEDGQICIPWDWVGDDG